MTRFALPVLALLLLTAGCDAQRVTAPRASLSIAETATATLTANCSGFRCDFTVTGTPKWDRLMWDFGDGARFIIRKSQGGSLAHTYDLAGTYTATVTVIYADSSAFNRSTTVTVPAP